MTDMATGCDMTGSMRLWGNPRWQRDIRRRRRFSHIHIYIYNKATLHLSRLVTGSIYRGCINFFFFLFFFRILFSAMYISYIHRLEAGMPLTSNEYSTTWWIWVIFKPSFTYHFSKGEITAITIHTSNQTCSFLVHDPLFCCIGFHVVTNVVGYVDVLKTGVISANLDFKSSGTWRSTSKAPITKQLLVHDGL